jgi:hypothetical protein
MQHRGNYALFPQSLPLNNKELNDVLLMDTMSCPSNIFLLASFIARSFQCKVRNINSFLFIKINGYLLCICNSPLQSNGSLAPFLFEFKLSGSVVTPSADNNGAPKGHYYLQRAVQPDHSAE